MSITIESAGRRHYLLGNTFPLRDQLRAAGAKWDPERKAWWTGKRDVAEQLVAKLAAAPAGETSSSGAAEQSGPGESATVAGKAEYKGRTYYLAGRVDRGRTHYDDRVDAVTTRDGAKCLLISRDGKLQFWAARGEIRVIKTYDKPTTIGRLKRFAEGMRNGSIQTCPNCGSPSCIGVSGHLCEED